MNTPAFPRLALATFVAILAAFYPPNGDAQPQAPASGGEWGMSPDVIADKKGIV